MDYELIAISNDASPALPVIALGPDGRPRVHPIAATCAIKSPDTQPLSSYAKPGTLFLVRIQLPTSCATSDALCEPNQKYEWESTTSSSVPSTASIIIRSTLDNTFFRRD
jgi:hypothetical protein